MKGRRGDRKGKKKKRPVYPQKKKPPKEEDPDYEVPPEVAAAETLVDGIMEKPVSDGQIFTDDMDDFLDDLILESEKKPKPAQKKKKTTRQVQQKPASKKVPQKAAGPRPTRPAKKPTGSLPLPGEKRKKRKSEALIPQPRKEKGGDAGPPDVIAGRRRHKAKTRAVKAETAGTREMGAGEMARRHKDLGSGRVTKEGRSKKKTRRQLPPEPPPPAEEEDVLEPRGSQDTDRLPDKKEKKSKKKSRKAPKSRGRAVPSYAFRGSGMWLTFLTLPRFLCVLLTLASLGLGAAVWGKANPGTVAKIPRFDPDWIDALLGQIPFDLGTLPAMPWLAAAPAGVFLILAAIFHQKVRSYRLRNTYVYNNVLADYQSTFGRLKWSVLNLLGTLLTGGLAWPWLHAASVAREYRLSELRRRETSLGFDGSGFQVLWLTILTILMLPAAILTLGLFFPVIAIRWIDWRQEHIVVPQALGDRVKPEFEGTTGALFWKLFGWALLHLVTGTLCGAFARADVWSWVAENTVLPDEERGDQHTGTGEAMDGKRTKTGRVTMKLTRGKTGRRKR
jgi:hypothetical protein